MHNSILYPFDCQFEQAGIRERPNVCSYIYRRERAQKVTGILQNLSKIAKKTPFQAEKRGFSRAYLLDVSVIRYWTGDSLIRWASCRTFS